MEKILKLKIADVVKETNDAISIHFKKPLLKKVKYTSGQYLTLLINLNDRVERRCYSLNSAPNVESNLSVTVKRVKDGKVSNYLFENIKKGDSMKVLYPMGSFTIKPNPKNKRHIVLFGAGSGITPLISILKTILTQEPESVVSLFYGNRDVESIIFNNTLNDYKAQYPYRLSLVHILETPGDFMCYKGRVERSQIPKLLAQLPEHDVKDTEYFICGPSGMMIEAEEGLKSAGVNPAAIHIEKFSAPPPSEEELQAEGNGKIVDQDVKITNKGKTTTVSVKANKTILDAALDKKLKLPYVCMDGICGTCKAKKTSGEVFMRKGHVLTKKELSEGYILPCICKPLTDDVELSFN